MSTSLLRELPGLFFMWAPSMTSRTYRGLFIIQLHRRGPAPLSGGVRVSGREGWRRLTPGCILGSGVWAEPAEHRELPVVMSGSFAAHVASIESLFPARQSA